MNILRLMLFVMFLAPEGTSGCYKLCIGNNLKTTEVILLKLHSKVKHDGKAIKASFPQQGQGHILRSRVRWCERTTEVNLIKPHRKLSRHVPPTIWGWGDILFWSGSHW